VLIATDIAARGIDVKGIALVVNFDIPEEPEAYVHRIGRTARMGASGFALSFCDPSERASFRDIQRLIRQTIQVHADHPYAANAPTTVQTEKTPALSSPAGRPSGSGFRFWQSNRRPRHSRYGSYVPSPGRR
jgi:ATP-dependent RNA helicase RhlE